MDLNADVIEKSASEAVLSKRAAIWKTFAVVATLMLLSIAFDAIDGVPYLQDVDDLLRAVQIRQWFDGKGFYDLAINGVAMPETYISPWSRIVDLPYFLIALVMERFMLPADALQAAYTIWPPVMAVGFAGSSSYVMARLLPDGARARFFALLAAVLLMTYAVLEFAPLRIDHHNMQLLALSAMLAGVSVWSFGGGALAGVAVAVSLRIGLETLPLIAAFWAALGLLWVARAPGSVPVFRAYSLIVALSSPLLTLALAGPSVLLNVESDIFSLPYNVAVFGFGIVSFAMTYLCRENRGPFIRLTGLTVSGLFVLSGVIYLWPSLLAGPYSMIDPLSREMWLEHVTQEHSILYAVRNGDMTILMMIVEQTCIVIFSALYSIRLARSGRPFALVVFAVGLCSFLADFYALRFIRFPAATLALFVPALIAEFSAGSVSRQKLYMGVFAAGFAVFSAAYVSVSHLMPTNVEPDQYAPVDFLIYDKCPVSDYRLLPGLPPGRYMTSSRIGLAALEEDARSIQVSNISYHRAAPGIRKMLEAFYGSDAEARKKALAPFDYIAFCAYVEETRKLFTPPPGTLFEAMADGKPWPGLEPIPVKGATRLHVYRLDHASLR